MTNPTKAMTTQTEQLMDFIRRDLGCNCPDEVFDDLRSEVPSNGFTGLPVDYLIRVGGRLLVGVCKPFRWSDIEEYLANCLIAGKVQRDAEGYDRFRLVVATSEPEVAEARLSEKLSPLLREDDRLHLHVVDETSLPELLK